MMSRLTMYLCPFAGDYSGACSVLFDLGGMVCIHDAAGCTGNYTLFDEPRWHDGESMVYCTALRKIDAILGNDEKVIGKIITAANEMNPNFIAIVGSPVPNVIGFDFQGVAKDIESRTSIKTFGMATSGIEGSYKTGIILGLRQILERMVIMDAEKKKNTVNLIGLTPLDMDEGNYQYLAEELAGMGLRLNHVETRDGHLCYSSFDAVRNFLSAELNLAVTNAGAVLARWAYEKYGIPYVEGLPLGENREKYAELCRKAAATGIPQSLFAVKPGADKPVWRTDRKKALIIYDSIMGQSIGMYLESLGWQSTVYSFFADDRFASEIGTGLIRDEAGLEELLGEADYDLLIADPFILDVPHKKARCIAMPHYAVSSKLAAGQNWLWLDEKRWRDMLI